MEKGELLAKLEPNLDELCHRIGAGIAADYAAISQAISMKRIADALEYQCGIMTAMYQPEREAAPPTSIVPFLHRNP